MKKLFIKEYEENKKLKEECVAEKISLPPNGNSEGRGGPKDGNFRGAVGVASRVFFQVAPSMIDKQVIAYSVGCLWHSYGKNPVRLYPKLQSQPIGLPKIFIDYLFFQADQSDCTKTVSIFDRFASSEER